MIKALKSNEDLALLVDQRDSSGPLINFFGKEAYSTDGFAFSIEISSNYMSGIYS